MSVSEVTVTLGDVATEPVDQGGPEGCSFIYVDIGSIDRETKQIVESKELPTLTAPSRARQRLRSGDVLISMTRPNLNAVAGVPPSLDGAVGSTGFHVLRSRWMQPGFLQYLVQTRAFVEAMSGLVQGALYPAVRPADILRFRFRLPPQAEQSRIVAKLEELLSGIDAGVAELRTAQKKLAQYRQSLLKSAVEGALTADWRAARRASEAPSLDPVGIREASPRYTAGADYPAPETETGAELLARILTERRARWEAKQLAKFKEQGKTPPKDWRSKYPEPVAPDTRKLPPLPEGWVWASGEQLCDFITKGTTPPKELDDGSPKVVPFLRVTNLTSNGELDFSDRVFVSRAVHEQFLARSIVYPKDVLMNIVGPPLGQVSIVPPDFNEWNINQAIAIFRAVEGVLPEFIAAYLLSSTAQTWLRKRSKTTAGQTNLTLEVCRELPIPLPCAGEQREIAERLDDQTIALRKQARSIEHALKQSAAQRQNILRAALAGQLVPQDPNDEPAAKLLERIRAERLVRGAVRPGRRRAAGTRVTA